MIELIITTIALLYWIMYCLYEGAREGIYWHEVMRLHISALEDMPVKDSYNEHKVWTIQRTFVITAFTCSVGMYSMVLDPSLTNALGFGVIFIGLACLFPLLHDGSYFHKRESLKKGTYPDGFMAQSSTSNAKINFTPSVRIILGFVGILILFGRILLLKMI